MTIFFRVILFMLVVAMFSISLHGVCHAKTYNIGLGSIQPNSNIRDLIILLLVTKKSDTVNINIDSSGGRMDIADDIHQAIVKSKANVVCHVPRWAASAAALLSTYSCVKFAKLDMSPNAVILFHFPYYCRGYFCSLQVPVVGGERLHFLKVLRLYFSKVLTKEEINRMYKENVDIVLPGSVIIKRLGL